MTFPREEKPTREKSILLLVAEIVLACAVEQSSPVVPRPMIADRFLAIRPDRNSQVRANYRNRLHTNGRSRSVGTRARLDVKQALTRLEQQDLLVRRDGEVEIIDMIRFEAAIAQKRASQGLLADTIVVSPPHSPPDHDQP